MKLNDKKQKNLLKIVWLMSDVIILIAIIYLFMIGSNSQKLIGVLGIILLIIEGILYKKGFILQ